MRFAFQVDNPSRLLHSQVQLPRSVTAVPSYIRTTGGFMQHIHHQLHFLPIVVSAVILWLLGALWYSPLLFAPMWITIIGRKISEKPKGVVHGMIASLIGDLLLAFVLTHIIIWSGADDVLDGIHIGLIVWIGFVLGPLYPQRVYEGRPFAYFAINGGYWLIGLTGIGALLAVWR